MQLQYFDKRDSVFLDFVEVYKNEVRPCNHMYDWLDSKKIERIDQILSIVHENRIVGISCEKIYGNYLRIGSPQYVLNAYRSLYSHSLFRENGFFSKHLITAKLKNLELFFSIHAYNKRMQLHAENFFKRRITTNKNLYYIDDVKFLGIHRFHYVDQFIFTYNVTDTESLLNVINCTS